MCRSKRTKRAKRAKPKTPTPSNHCTGNRRGGDLPAVAAEPDALEGKGQGQGQRHENDWRVAESLPEGWKIRISARASGAVDRFYMSPTGKKFRSLKQVQSALAGNHGCCTVHRDAKVSSIHSANIDSSNNSASGPGKCKRKQQGMGMAADNKAAPKKAKRLEQGCLSSDLPEACPHNNKQPLRTSTLALLAVWPPAVGTAVRKRFPGYGWYNGTVESLEIEHANCKWHDGSTSRHRKDDVLKSVADAQ
jgi:hypothetical protein